MNLCFELSHLTKSTREFTPNDDPQTATTNNNTQTTIMCFTQPISLGFTLLGLAATVYFVIRKPPEYLRFALATGYFVSMEFLQFISYSYLDQCGTWINWWLTIIGWTHIAFQPVFSNLVLSVSFPRGSLKRQIVDRYVIPMCVLGGFFLLTLVVGVDQFGLPCQPGRDPLCGTETCTLSGPVHLYWVLRYRAADYITPSGFTHFFLMFTPPLLLGEWLGVTVLFITGPVLAITFSKGSQTQAAPIWCFYSVAQIILILAFSIIKAPHLHFHKASSTSQQKQQLDQKIKTK